MSHAPIPRIDDNNTIVGETSIPEAVANQWFRRVARVFVFDTQGRVLLQQRSLTITGFPGRWDQAAGGHVDVGEEPVTTAKRETEEELGLAVEPVLVASPLKIDIPHDRQFAYVYKAVVQPGVPLQLYSADVAATAWCGVPDLEARLLSEPDSFVPAFHIVWQELRDTLIAT